MKSNVLHIATALSWRGGEQQAAYLLEELVGEVEAVMLCSEGSKMAQYCSQKGFTFVTHKKKNSLHLGFAKKIKSLCKEKQIDLIHVHDAHAHTFSILAASVFGNKTPILLSRRVDFPIKENLFSKYKYNHSAIKKILCVSDTIKRITAAGINERSKLETVYSGIDLTKFKPASGKLRKELKVDTNSYLIGNTSALADHKDYFTFIDVAEKIIKRHNNCHFVVMGDGPMKSEIKNYAESKKLNGQFTFTGFRNDIAEVLAEVDMFLITSKTEGLGTSILDAFACKIPVVGTSGGGIAELIEDETTGLLCEVKNVEQLTSAVERMMQDEALRKKCVAKAHEKVQLFSKKNTALNTLNFYREVLA